MTQEQGLLLALLVLVLVFGGLLAATAAGRAHRRRRMHRDAVLIAPHRHTVMELVAGDPDSAAAAARELALVSPAVWEALEPMIRGLLLKVRGDAHTAVVSVLQRRGVIQRSIRNLGDRRIARRAFAAELLGATGTTEAVPGLIALLSDPEQEVRVVAARALGRIGDPTAVNPLFDALLAGVPARVVASALVAIEAHDHADLRAALNHPDPLHRAIACEVAGLIGAAQNVVDLVNRLDDAELEVRIRAARALGRIGLPSSRRSLERVTRASYPGPLRVVATKALGEVADPAGLSTLLLLLADPDPRVAEHAAHGLLGCGPYGTMVLEQAERDGGEMAQVAAGVLAIARLRGEAAPAPEVSSPLGITLVPPPEPLASGGRR